MTQDNLKATLDAALVNAGECDCGHLRRTHDGIGVCQASGCACQDGEYRTDCRDMRAAPGLRAVPQ